MYDCQKEQPLLSIFLPAPRVDFIQVDWNSTAEWETGQKFCTDKELYVADVNGDKKYVTDSYTHILCLNCSIEFGEK